jgi:hypothetical protein
MCYFSFFFANYQEISSPFIKLTKSKTGNISTGTLLFVEPKVLKDPNLIPLDTFNLYWTSKKKNCFLKSSNVKLIYKKNKIYAIKILFVFLEIKELHSFLNFIIMYNNSLQSINN